MIKGLVGVKAAWRRGRIIDGDGVNKKVFCLFLLFLVFFVLSFLIRITNLWYLLNL